MRKDAPIINAIRDKTGVKTTLTPDEDSMTEEFIRGMAEQLGVSPETVNKELVKKWVVNWNRGLLKTERWVQQGYAKRLGIDLIRALPIASRPSPPPSSQEVREPPRGESPEQDRRDRFYRSSDLSIT